MPGFTVLSMRDLQAAIAHEADRQLLGCDDEGCLAEIADAVDADLLIHGTLTTTSDAVTASAPTITLTLLNTRALVVVNRVSFTWRGDPRLLSEVVASAAQHLVVPAAQRKPGGIRVVGLPDDAQVFVDGVDRTFAARRDVLAGIATGPHEVQATLDGKLPSTTYVLVQSGAIATVQPAFVDAPLPDLVVWGGVVTAAVVGIGATLGIVWATTRADVSATVAVPVWDPNDVEKLRRAR